MKQLLGILAVLAGASSTASASLIAYDGFDYDATGNPVLGTSATNLGTTGTWTSQGKDSVNGFAEKPVITSGSLTYPGLPASVGNSVLLNDTYGQTAPGANGSRYFTGTIDSSSTPTVYYSMVVSLPSSSVDSTKQAYFAGLDNLTAGTYTSFGGLLVRQDPNDSTKIDLGIETSGNNNVSWSGTAYSPNDPVFVVVSFTFGGPATLDVFADGAPLLPSDPGAGNHTATSAGSDASTVTSLSNFYLRGNVSEPPGIVVDELRIGTSWQDVAPVPEPASVGLLSLGAIGLLARRRRKA
jgi:hypothetical protein